MLRASLFVLLVLIICATIFALRIRTMHRARCELRRREAMRVTHSIDTLVAHYEKLALRLTCDVAPAIEGIAKAFDAFAEVGAAAARRFESALQGEDTNAASDRVRDR